MALDMLRSEECPNCHQRVTPDIYSEVTMDKVHCPVCKTDYQRLRAVKEEIEDKDVDEVRP